MVSYSDKLNNTEGDIIEHIVLCIKIIKCTMLDIGTIGGVLL